MIEQIAYWEEYHQQKRTEYFRKYKRGKRESESENLRGSYGELLALMFLSGSRIDRKPDHDIIWEGMKIEVKIAHPRRGVTPAWEFHMTQIQVDHSENFLFICLNDMDKAITCYFIPKGVISSKDLRIGPVTRYRYEQYIIPIL